MVQNIELWAIERLIPFARNPRTHSEAQVAQIAASIAEFGLNNPILVDTKAGIIAGNNSRQCIQTPSPTRYCQ
jgi:ParB-like chromosome segregation protein Spo0J